jgi:hypothetical protein
MLYCNENPFGPTFDASIVYGPVLDKCIMLVYVLKLNNLKKIKDEKYYSSIVTALFVD